MNHSASTPFLGWSLGFTATLSVTLSVTLAHAQAPASNPSEWKCALCPFLDGYQTETEAGVLYASGANAVFGRYTGIDHSGPYVDAAASGEARSHDGTYADYGLENLGLASRQGFVEGGREGKYDLRVSYDGQPQHLFDTASTPFQSNGSTLGLPAGWIPSGSTAGMTSLAGALSPVRLESERRTTALLVRYFASPAWTLFGEYRRQEKDGTGATSASFLTEALQIPQPFTYVTNSFEAGAAWAGRMASLRMSYTGSWFTDDNDSTSFANPYLPILPGSVQGQLATPPTNDLQQLAASGSLQLPWFATTLTFGASLGVLRQNDAFLPVSTLAGSSALLPGSLDGDVHLSHYTLGLSAHPFSKLSLRGSAAYDGRDDKTSPLSVAYVVTDSYPGGTALTPRYSEDRVRLDGSADYAWARWLRVGIGGKFNDNHYGPGQIYTNTQETQSWGHATVTPLDALSITVKAGNGLRKASSFDADAVPAAESPLVRGYEYAPRDRVFSSLSGSWNATSTLTWTLEAYLAKDDYRSSPLGLQADHEQRVSTALTWSPRATLSGYIDAGYQRLFLLENGASGSFAAPWLAAQAERFWNVAVGGRWIPQERWTISVDHLLAPSYTDVDSTVAGLQQGFPQNWTKLESTHVDLQYRWTAALQLHFRYTRETYNSNDWALAGVGAATIPNLLAFGVQPYRDNANVVGVTLRYQFGREISPAARGL
jgi:MtrB/PioB family decaheme-associated outer membrane protein